jgi:adenylyltransferase/sulfurtransferase
MQAAETIKLLLGIGDSLTGRLFMYDALSATTTTLKLQRDPHCPACGEEDRLTELIDYEAFCNLGGRV